MTRAVGGGWALPCALLASGSWVLGCEASSEPPPRTAAHALDRASEAPASPSDSTPVTMAPAPSPAEAAPSLHATLFARMHDDFLTCYTRGRTKAPAMNDGRVTLQASVSMAGKATCVVPTEDTGLTGEVEECLSERLSRETFPAEASSISLPIVFREGEALLGAKSSRLVTFERVDTTGLSDASDVIRAMVPDLTTCVRQGLGARASEAGTLFVSGRVGRSGEVTCALATSTQPLPEEVRLCAADRLRQAKFAPPKSGKGVVSIPVTIVGQR